MLQPSYYFSFQDTPIATLFQDCICVWDALKNLSIYLKNQDLGKIEVSISEGVFLENPELISIGEGTILEPGVYIKGPALIGKNCEIRHGAYLRENVILCDGAVVGHDSEIKNSILFPRAHAAHFNYVGDSILGSDTNLGAGVICANFRLDHREIRVEIEGEKIGTGLTKFGLILGDHSQIGCNSVTNPGTMIGKNVFCHPCINVGGVIPSSSKIKSQKTYIVEA